MISYGAGGPKQPPPVKQEACITKQSLGNRSTQQSNRHITDSLSVHADFMKPTSVLVGLHAGLPRDRAPAVDLIAHDAAQFIPGRALQVDTQGVETLARCWVVQRGHPPPRAGAPRFRPAWSPERPPPTTG